MDCLLKMVLDFEVDGQRSKGMHQIPGKVI